VVCVIRIRCRRCGRRFEICRRCYRGHVHCSKKCSAGTRRRSIRAAQRKYRRQPEIIRAHREQERERRRRQRQACVARVGDQGSPAVKVGTDWEEKWARGEGGGAKKSNETGGEVVAIATQATHREVAETVADILVGTRAAGPAVCPAHRCAFCGRAGHVVKCFPRRETGRRLAVRSPNQRC
jgi:nitrite reductase/ring-hydroxylating ferredoxin subunit